MANFDQDRSRNRFPLGSAQDCARCEAMLADALDGTLSDAEQAQFDLHMAGCTTCGQMLADAQRGAAWLELLRSPRPEPPAALLERILAQTAGHMVAESRHLSTFPAGLPEAADGVPALRTATILPFRSRMATKFHLRSIGHSMLQPRLAMTAAMAFFSIGLTLNLTGVRLNELRASDLKPSSVKRSFYQANAHVVRYVDNMRAVYELESRVRDLQHDSDNDAIPAPSRQEPATEQPDPNHQQPEQKQQRPRPGSGTSQRQSPPEPLSRPLFRLVDLAVSPSRGLADISALVSDTPQKGEFV
jgi:hypothetical protein